MTIVGTRNYRDFMFSIPFWPILKNGLLYLKFNMVQT